MLSFEETVRLTAEWYRSYYSGAEDMYEVTAGQIERYVGEAARQGLTWAMQEELA